MAQKRYVDGTQPALAERSAPSEATYPAFPSHGLCGLARSAPGLRPDHR